MSVIAISRLLCIYRFPRTVLRSSGQFLLCFCSCGTSVRNELIGLGEVQLNAGLSATDSYRRPSLLFLSPL